MNKNFEIDEKDYHIRIRFLRSCSNIIIYTCTTVYFLQLLFPFSFFLFFFFFFFFSFHSCCSQIFHVFYYTCHCSAYIIGRPRKTKTRTGISLDYWNRCFPCIFHTHRFFFFFFVNINIFSLVVVLNGPLRRGLPTNLIRKFDRFYPSYIRVYTE